MHLTLAHLTSMIIHFSIDCPVIYSAFYFSRVIYWLCISFAAFSVFTVFSAWVIKLCIETPSLNYYKTHLCFALVFSGYKGSNGNI